jgi:hypothetical protein
MLPVSQLQPLFKALSYFKHSYPHIWFIELQRPVLNQNNLRHSVEQLCRIDLDSGILLRLSRWLQNRAARIVETPCSPGKLLGILVIFLPLARLVALKTSVKLSFWLVQNILSWRNTCQYFEIGVSARAMCWNFSTAFGAMPNGFVAGPFQWLIGWGESFREGRSWVISHCTTDMLSRTLHLWIPLRSVKSASVSSLISLERKGSRFYQKISDEGKLAVDTSARLWRSFMQLEELKMH